MYKRYDEVASDRPRLIHKRLETAQSRISQICPSARPAIAHGGTARVRCGSSRRTIRGMHHNVWSSRP